MANDRFAATVAALLGARQLANISQPEYPTVTQFIRSATSPYKVNAIKPVKIGPSGGSGGSGSGGSSGLTSEFQTLVNKGLTTQKAAEQVQAMAEARDRASVAAKPKEGGFITTQLLRKAGHLPKQLGSVVGKSVLHYLDYMSRPGLAVTTAEYGQAKDLMNALHKVKEGGIGNLGASDVLKVGKELIPGGLGRAPEFYKGLTKSDAKTGSQVINKLGWAASGGNNPLNRTAHGLSGFGLDLVSDPTSWFSFGATSGAKEASAKLAEQGIKGVGKKEAVSELNKVLRTTKRGASQGTKRLAPGEADAIAARVTEKVRPIIESAEYINKPVHRITGDSTLQTLIHAAKAAPDYKMEADRLLQGYADNIATALNDSAGKHALQLRLGFLGHGKDVLEGTKLGEQLWKPLSYTNGKLSHIRPVEILNNAFNFESHFPGLTARMRQAANSHGYQHFMAQRRNIANTFHSMTQDQKKRMSHAIETPGFQFAAGEVDKKGRSLNEIMQEAKDYFATIAKEEVSAGLRDQKSILNDGTYLYHFFDKAYKDSTNINDWRKYRKGILGLGTNARVSLKDAMKYRNAQGVHLKPVEEIDRILLARQAKSSRDLIRHWYRSDVINGYGTFIKNDATRAYKRGLIKDMKRVDDKYLTPQIRKLAKAQNGAFYLPQDIHNTFRKMSDMMAMNSPEVKTAWRWLDKANRHFKFAATVPNPAYHMRNMMGDAMFSWLDNANLADYGKVGDAAFISKVLKKTPKDFTLKDGLKYSYDELRNAYDNNVGVGGFFSTDVSNPLNKITGGLRTAAEKRENLGRIAHFKSAFEQEYAALRKDISAKTLTPQQAADLKQRAFRAAGDRVDKFNIDYNAITPFEQQWVKRFIPFYTFQRKAIPLMMENTLTNPGRMLAMEKAGRAIQESLGVDQTMPFPDFGMPDWAKMPGLIRLNNDAQPSFLNLDFGPNAQIPGLLGGSPNPGDWAGQVLSKLNPAIRLPFEIKQGKTFFGNKPISSGVEAIYNEMNPFRSYAETVSQAAREKSGTGLGERIAKSAGAPWLRATEARQIGTNKAKEEQYKAVLGKINDALTKRGYEFQTTTRNGQKLYRVIDRINGTVLFESDSPVKAQQYANKLYS